MVALSGKGTVGLNYLDATNDPKQTVKAHGEVSYFLFDLSQLFYSNFSLVS